MTFVNQHPFSVKLDTFFAQQLQLAFDILSAWNRMPITFEATDVLGELISS
jgi:hypothetical protein